MKCALVVRRQEIGAIIKNGRHRTRFTQLRHQVTGEKAYWS
jgi:hypothetical protein